MWRSLKNQNKQKLVEGNDSDSLMPAHIASKTDDADAFRYAGYFRRACASRLDEFIFGFVSVVVLVIANFNRQILMHFAARLLGIQASDIFNWIFCFLLIPLMICGFWLYYAALNSTSIEGTIGQRLLKLRALDVEGKHLTLLHSTIKFCIPLCTLIVALIVFGIGALALLLPSALAVTAQTCGSLALVCWALGALIILLACFGDLFFVNRKRQTVFDLVGKEILVERAYTSSVSSFEKKLLLSVPVALIFLCLQVPILFYCHINTNHFDTNDQFSTRVLNKTGNVWIATKDLAVGDSVELSKQQKEKFSLIRTPPFSLDSTALHGRVLITSAVSAGQILTYQDVVFSPVPIPSIASIDPVAEKNLRLSKRNTELIRDDNSDAIEKLLTSSVAANEKAKYADALRDSGEALAQLQALFKKKENSVYVGVASPSLKPLASKLKVNLFNLEIRSLVIDILAQQALAHEGLKQLPEAKQNASDCLALLTSMHENFYRSRMGDVDSLPSLTNSDDNSGSDQSNSDARQDKLTVKYVSMLSKADEQRYHQYLNHFKNLLGKSAE